MCVWIFDCVTFRHDTQLRDVILLEDAGHGGTKEHKSNQQSWWHKMLKQYVNFPKTSMHTSYGHPVRLDTNGYRQWARPSLHTFILKELNTWSVRVWLTGLNFSIIKWISAHLNNSVMQLEKDERLYIGIKSLKQTTPMLVEYWCLFLRSDFAFSFCTETCVWAKWAANYSG